MLPYNNLLRKGEGITLARLALDLDHTVTAIELIIMKKLLDLCKILHIFNIQLIWGVTAECIPAVCNLHIFNVLS